MTKIAGASTLIDHEYSSQNTGSHVAADGPNWGMLTNQKSFLSQENSKTKIKCRL